MSQIQPSCSIKLSMIICVFMLPCGFAQKEKNICEADLEPWEHHLDLVCSEITPERCYSFSPRAKSLRRRVMDPISSWFQILKHPKKRTIESEKHFSWGMVMQHSSSFHLNILKIRSWKENNLLVAIRAVDLKSHYQCLKAITTISIFLSDQHGA